MSDCRKGGRLTYLPPEPPTLKRLAELNGEPPWELEIPVPDMLPPEGVDFIGAVVMGGARFERVEGGRCMNPDERDCGRDCDGCGWYERRGA